MLRSKPGCRERNAKSSSARRPSIGRYRSTENDSTHSGVTSSMVVLRSKRRRTGATPRTPTAVEAESRTSRAKSKHKLRYEESTKVQATLQENTSHFLP